MIGKIGCDGGVDLGDLCEEAETEKLSQSEDQRQPQRDRPSPKANDRPSSAAERRRCFVRSWDSARVGISLVITWPGATSTPLLLCGAS
jgi:hypothetical protein